VEPTQPIKQSKQQEPQTVTAIMVVNDRRRIRFAQRSALCFREQTYRPSRLVIVNSSGSALFSRIEGVEIHELLVDAEKYTSIGQMRNLAVQEFVSDWYAIWNDDSWSHPHRLLFQMAHRVNGCLSVLANTIRVDVSQQARDSERLLSVLHREPGGVAETLMFQKFDYCGWFHDKGNTPEVEYLERLDDRVVVLDNHQGTFPGPMLHVAFYYDGRPVDKDEFMAPANVDGAFTDTHVDYLRHVVAQHAVIPTERVESGTAIVPST